MTFKVRVDGKSADVYTEATANGIVARVPIYGYSGRGAAAKCRKVAEALNNALDEAADQN